MIKLCVIASEAKQSFKRSPRPLWGLAMTLILSIAFSGCYILEKLPELSTMGEYSREKDEQHRSTKHLDANYEALVAAIATGKLQQYPDKTSIRKAFEEPIAIKTIEFNGQAQEQWLYRQMIPQKAKDRVYLYFDHQGRLVRFEKEKIQW